MSNYCVYKHTFPNGKVYIGMTGQEPEKRFDGGNGYRKCPKMYHAILKYGWNNVEHELLYTGLSKQEAETKEIEMIAFYGSVENGYNIDHGGNVRGTHSVETRQKISAGNRGKKKPPVSEERKCAYAERFSGSGNPFYGRHHTEEVRTAQSLFMMGNNFNKGNHHTDEFKAWKSAQMRAKYSDGKNPRCKLVIRTSQDGTETVFCSLRSAASSVDKSPSTLLKYINKQIEFCGFKWRYANETGS